MLFILWEYRIKKNQRRQFERYYAATGPWATLFRQGPGHQGTTLLRDPERPDRYLTIDCWRTLAAFRRFKKKFAKEYAGLDEAGAKFTQAERCLGHFETP